MLLTLVATSSAAVFAGRLHAVRSVLGLVSLLVMLVASSQQGGSS